MLVVKSLWLKITPEIETKAFIIGFLSAVVLRCRYPGGEGVRRVVEQSQQEIRLEGPVPRDSR